VWIKFPRGFSISKSTEVTLASSKDIGEDRGMVEDNDTQRRTLRDVQIIIVGLILSVIGGAIVGGVIGWLIVLGTSR